MPLELHVLARLGTICCTGGFLALISVRFRKNVVTRFSPGFGRSPNPGQASDSKPRGGSVKASMGGIAQALTYLLVCCLGSSSQRLGGGGGGLYCTDTLCCVAFEVV